MTERPIMRRRRRRMLIPLLGSGVAAWVTRSRFGRRTSVEAEPPSTSVAAVPRGGSDGVRAAETGPVEPGAEAVAEKPVPAEQPAAEAVTVEPVPAEPAAAEAVTVEPVPAEPAAAEPVTAEAAADPAAPAPVSTGPAADPATVELARPGEPAGKPRVAPAASAAASVAAPARPDPDAPFGPGSVRALPDGSSPDPAHTVKGKLATRVFHVPGGTYFSRTKADVWFRTEDDALAAGFTPWAPRRRR